MCQGVQEQSHAIPSKACYHFIFPKINKRGGWNKSGGGLEHFSKINKRGTIIQYSRVHYINKIVLNWSGTSSLVINIQYIPLPQSLKYSSIKVTFNYEPWCVEPSGF